MDVDIHSSEEHTIFVAGLDRGSEIAHIIQEALDSNNDKKRNKYKGVQFRNSVCTQLTLLKNKKKSPLNTYSSSCPPRSFPGQRSLNRPAQRAIHSIDDLFDNSTLLLDKKLYDDGIPNLSSAKNIATYALEASGVGINSMSVTERTNFIRVCNALAEDLNNFDITKSCVLCGDTGHTFSDCKTT